MHLYFVSKSQNIRVKGSLFSPFRAIFLDYIFSIPNLKSLPLQPTLDAFQASFLRKKMGLKFQHCDGPIKTYKVWLTVECMTEMRQCAVKSN